MAKLTSKVFGGTAMAPEVAEASAKCDATASAESTSVGECAESDGASEEEQALPPELPESDERAGEAHEVVAEAEAMPECDDGQEAEQIGIEPPHPEPAHIMEEAQVQTTAARKTPPAHTADRQAQRRAAKRYREVGGRWVKGKEDGESWVQQADAPMFDSLDEALRHERQKTAQRRCTWPNLKAHIAATRDAVISEAANGRAHTTEEAVATRHEVIHSREVLSQQLQEGVDRIMESRRPLRRDSEAHLEFFTRLLELRAVDLRELLANHALEPAGTKPALARIAALNMNE